VPFENVYLHGLVLDDKGKKMSKSKGNVINPLDMSEKYGADATRLSLVIGTSPGNDMRINEEKIAGFRNMVNKLWNISRYIIQVSNDEFQVLDLNKEKLSLADNWILEKMEKLILEVSNDLDKYNFSQAGEKLREFTWDDLADWYIEATKFDQAQEKNKVLILVLRNLLKLWHPFIPFVTEVIWKEFNESDLIIEEWPISHNPSTGSGQVVERITRNGESDFEKIKNIISAIRNARAENKVEPGRKVKAIVYAGEDLKLIQENIELIKGMRTGIEDLEILEKGDEIENEIKIVVDNFVIYLIGAIDKEKEALRIKKEKENLEKQIGIIKKKLDNKDFVDRAPENVVEGEKEKLGKLEKDLKEIGSGD
jgi:valyl-tRNA synthetase